MDKNVQMDGDRGNTGSSARVHRVDDETASKILDILRRNNLMKVAEEFKAEIGKAHEAFDCKNADKILTSYKCDEDGKAYMQAYFQLIEFCQFANDGFSFELNSLMYPIFVCMYLELVYNNFEKEAASFMESYAALQEFCFSKEIQALAQITCKAHMTATSFAVTFKSAKPTLCVSNTVLNNLKHHLNESDNTIITRILKSHPIANTYAGEPFSLSHKDVFITYLPVCKRGNDEKIYYGVQPISSSRQCHLSAKNGCEKEQDLNMPPSERIFSPKLNQIEKRELEISEKESYKRVTLNADVLPSCVCYTILNDGQITVSCCTISDDSNMLAMGFEDGKIKVWSLSPDKLKAMKPADMLSTADFHSEDFWDNILDDKSGEVTKTLLGHTSCVTALVFCPFKDSLLSASHDQTIRLWSTLLWSSMLVYNGHMSPVWDVSFAPHARFFCSGAADRTVRMWAISKKECVRFFPGHTSDVCCVAFHPNSNYIASGSNDRTIRLWDCVTGNQARLMMGHKNAVKRFLFSLDGRFLVSSGLDCSLIVWDINTGYMKAVLTGHASYPTAMAFSRDGNIFVSGSGDYQLKFWDFDKLMEEAIGKSGEDEVLDDKSFNLKNIYTKISVPLHLAFSRRNVLYAIVRYEHKS